MDDTKTPDLQSSNDEKTVELAENMFFVFGTMCLLGAFIFWLLTGRLYPPIAVMAVAGGGLTSIGAWLHLRDEKREEVRRKEQIQRTLGEASKSDYFEKLVSINVENLSAYYTLVKAHASKSFLAALAVGIAGFLLIVAGISMAMQGKQASVAELSGLSGIVTEFISAIFFYLYNRTVRQMKEYHDSLLSVQNVLLSLKLIDGDIDTSARVQMIESMLGYLIGHHRLKAQSFNKADS